jgi:hypothetical protein
MESEDFTLAVDAANTGQGRSTSECGHSSCKQTAQEISPVEIIVHGEMFDQPGRILRKESQGSVESDRLSTLDPLIHNDMPASPPQNYPVSLKEPNRGQVSFEEAIRCLNESQSEKLDFSFDSEVDGYDEAYKEHCRQFIHAVNTCQSLKELTISIWNQKLSIEEVQLLCQNLLPALNSLTLEGVLDNDGVQIVCEKMANNCVLKNLVLWNYEGRMSNAGASLGSMLAINSTLDSLDLLGTDLGPNGVEALLQPLTGHATDPPLNKSLTHLIIGGYGIQMGQGAGETIAQMLRTNNTLTHFSMWLGIGLEPLDVCKILESLQKNQTLLSLGLFGCQGVKGADVLAKMMDLVRMHPCLMKINLLGTPLEREGQAAQVRAQLKNNAKDYMAVLRGMPRVPPKFVRVFLCGNAYFGNSAFSLSLNFLFCCHYLHLWNCVNHINVLVMTPQWCFIQFQHSHTFSFLNLNHMSFEK